MSEDYVKDTQGDIGRELGTSSDHSALMEMDNFIWEDVSEEIGRFEKFDVDMQFTTSEWCSFSKSLGDYIAVKRLLSKVSNNIVPVSNSPKLDMDAKSVLMSKSASAAFISKDGAKHQWNQAAKRLALQCE
jgi:hypothetical protein